MLLTERCGMVLNDLVPRTTTNTNAPTGAERGSVMDTNTFLATRDSWVAAGRPSQGHPYCDQMVAAAAKASGPAICVRVAPDAYKVMEVGR